MTKNSPTSIFHAGQQDKLHDKLKVRKSLRLFKRPSLKNQRVDLWFLWLKIILGTHPDNFYWSDLSEKIWMSFCRTGSIFVVQNCKFLYINVLVAYVILERPRDSAVRHDSTMDHACQLPNASGHDGAPCGGAAARQNLCLSCDLSCVSCGFWTSEKYVIWVPLDCRSSTRTRRHIISLT